jgi:hypothetical protein
MLDFFIDQLVVGGVFCFIILVFRIRRPNSLGWRYFIWWVGNHRQVVRFMD